MARTSPSDLTASLDPMLPSMFEIISNRRETSDTRTIELRPLNDGLSVNFAPGQFTMLWVPGVGEIPISISGDPHRHDRFSQTIRKVGAVSTAILDQKKQLTIGVRGPYGTHWPVERYRGVDVMVIAGGIGLAPLRPVIYSVLAERSRYRNVEILYGARHPNELLFTRELESWRGRLDLNVHVSVDSAGRTWRGNVGPVTTLISRAKVDPESTGVFVCGPEIMMRFVARELVERGFSPDRIWVSMERNMKCGVGLCGHCQVGPLIVCRDGPVFTYSRIEHLMKVRGL